jgi:hypothetical protein
MDLSNVSLVLLLAACAGWGWLVSPGRAGRIARGRGLALRGLLVFAALLAHLDTFELKPQGGLQLSLPPPHLHEVLHYFVGTRYFAELGYDGLYDAVAVADLEDAPSFVVPGVRMRDLATNRTLGRRRHLRAVREPVRAAFSDVRWQAFKHDVGVLRAAAEPRVWKIATLDHGYNGTPLVAALLGGVANAPGLTIERLLGVVAFVDPLLIAGFSALVWTLAGGPLALTFLFFALANPLNDYAFIGASYLRYGYWLALAGAALALRRNALATSGVLFALSGWLRIFPLALYGALALRDLAHSDRRTRLAANRRLHVGFAAASLAILAATSLLPTPDGLNPWLAFYEKITLHADASGVNQIHVGVPLVYSAATEKLSQQDMGNYWERDRERVRRQRATWIRAATAAGLVFACVTLLRVRRDAAIVPGLLAVYCALPLTHYYWASLAVIPLLLPELRLQRGLLLLYVALALTAAPGVLEERRDLQFALESVWVLAFLVWACLALWNAPAEPEGAS